MGREGKGGAAEPCCAKRCIARRLMPMEPNGSLSSATRTARTPLRGNPVKTYRAPSTGGNGTLFHTSRAADSVCASCVSDPALKMLIAPNALAEQCAFCGAADVHAINVGALFDILATGIAVEWDPVRSADLIDPTAVDSAEVLSQLDVEPFVSDSLRAEFLRAFTHQWRRRDDISHYQRRLGLSWDQFCNYVTTQHRYLFLRAERTGDPALVAPNEMLDELAHTMHAATTHLFRILPEGSTLVRARGHDAGERPRGAKELGSPPPEKAASNRMSAAGISMFYAAEEPDVATIELRDDWGAITTATWAVTRPLQYLDLTVDKDVPTLFAKTARTERSQLRFLQRFAELLSERPGEHAELTYVPTQIVTEYVRYVLRDTTTGRPVEGICYSSSHDRTKRCWVLFAGPSDCGDPEATPPPMLRIDPATAGTQIVTPTNR